MDVVVVDTQSGSLSRFPVADVWPKYLIGTESDIIQNTLLIQGNWELGLIQQAEKRLVPGSIFLDIGAHIGTWGITLARARKDVRVVAFEPQRELYYQLCGNIFLNGLVSSMSAHFVALGSPEEEGTYVSLWKFPGNKGMARIEPYNYDVVEGKFARDEKERVEIRCLDSWDLFPISVIKMDVEGHESQVLRGARKTLERNGFPPIFFECWSTPAAEGLRKTLLKTLLEIGYTHIYALSGGYHQSDWLAERILSIPYVLPRPEEHPLEVPEEKKVTEDLKNEEEETIASKTSWT